MTPARAAERGSSASATSTTATSSPVACTAAVIASTADMRPDERGPESSTMRPRTRPPPVSASSAGEPAGKRDGAGCAAAEMRRADSARIPASTSAIWVALAAITINILNR